MAPKAPSVNDIANASDNEEVLKKGRGQQTRRHRHKDRDVEQLLPDEDGPREIGLLRQLAACAGVLASDGGLVFMQLAMLPTLQTLGVPVASVTLPGCLSGTMALLGLPLLGWITDRGSNPNGRKKPAVVVAALVFITGFSLVISGCAFHTWGGVGIGQAGQGLAEGDITTYPFPAEIPSSLESINDTIFTSSQISSAEISGATFTQNPSTTDDSTPAEVSTVSSIIPMEGMSNETFPDPEEENDDDDGSGSSDWMDDPLGLAIPLAGLLGILGFAFIDMGNDLNNSCQKSFVLASTSPTQHVSLLVVGVQMSAVGGCVAAALGVFDVAGLLTQGTILDTVPGKTFLQCSIFVCLTLVCVMTTLLSTPSIQPVKAPEEVTSSATDVTSPKHLSYGAIEDATDIMRKQAASAPELATENVVSEFSDNLLKSPSTHFDENSNRYPHDVSCSVTLTYADSSVSEDDLARSSDSFGESGDTVLLMNDDRIQAHHLSCHSLSVEQNAAVMFIRSLRENNSVSRSAHYTIPEHDVPKRDAESGGGQSRKGFFQRRKTSPQITTESEQLPSSRCCGFLSRETRQLTLICASMFFMTGAWQSFNVCTTDFLGKVMYGGDPEADPESESYAAYQRGMQTGSVGVLVLNVMYVVANFLQRKLLSTVDKKPLLLAVLRRLPPAHWW